MADAIAVTAAGFAEPGDDAQVAFRTVLTALSEPGRIMSLPLALPTGLPAGPAALGLLLTLADGDTPLWLDAAARPAAPYLQFHTGAPIVSHPAAAAFALVTDAESCPPLDAFDIGDEDYPDRSATLIIEVSHLAEGGSLILRGPGIADRRGLTVGGLPRGFGAGWAANHALFPRGIDVLLTCGDRLAGLPRSVILEDTCT
jgi:alpha-D-ribose 1-methylphosphonate 5-triphosphate synthase subunit PhnH